MIDPAQRCHSLSGLHLHRSTGFRSIFYNLQQTPCGATPYWAALNRLQDLYGAILHPHIQVNLIASQPMMVAMLDGFKNRGG
jgi:hypothetical protein